MSEVLSSVLDEVGADFDPTDLWWLGAIMYVIGSILINLGSNVIRKDHSLQEGEEEKQPPYQRPLWMGGFTIFAIGNVLNFVAFMFAAQSLLAALGSIQFVTNIIFAGMINKEPITKRAIIATIIIILGNFFIIWFGSKNTKNYDLQELKELLFASLFLGYLACIAVLVGVLQGIYWFFEDQMKRNYLPPNTPPVYMEKYMPFAYASVSAIIGTNTIIFGKVCAGLLHGITQGDKVYLNIWLYVIIGLFVVTMIFWLYRMNNALRMYDAMFIIPVLQCVWLLFGVIGGEVFFQEFRDMTAKEASFFSAGVVILLIGISILRPSAKTEEEQIDVELDELGDAEEEEEERKEEENENIEKEETIVGEESKVAESV